MKIQKRKPVTMITGYLGSGKTTVLNELLKSQTGERLAIIVNDLGSINIDASLTKKNSVYEAETKMIEMTNGCICCTLQEAFMEQMEELYEDDYGITSFAFVDPRPFDYDKFIDLVSYRFPEQLIRGKGYMWFKTDDVHVHLFEQAGRNSSVTEVSNWVASMPPEEQEKVFEEFPDLKAEWHEKYGDRLNQLVFIGKDYDKDAFVKDLKACLAE